MGIQVIIDNPGQGEWTYGGEQVGAADPGTATWKNNAADTRIDISVESLTGMSSRATLVQFEDGALIYVRKDGLDRMYSVQAAADNTTWFSFTVTAESSAPGFAIATTDVTALMFEPPKGEGGGSGVTDHGALSGLSDDDHSSVYFDASRGDARWAAEAHNHAGLYLDEAAHDALPSDNPHSVDAADVGLGSVDDTADADKPISTATQTALDDKLDETSHDALPSDNPHSVDATDVGLGSVDNTADLDKPISDDTQTALDTKLTETTHDALPSDNPHGVDAADVGLGNADDTADVDKPVSTDQQTALDLKQDLSEKSAASGYASLDSGTKVPVAELPDSALDGATGDSFAASHPAAGHTNTPTTQQKAALAGTNGTPDTGNEYVTDSDSRMADDRDPTAHSHEGVTILSGAEGAGKVLTSTAGGVSSWEGAGAPGAHDLGGAVHTAGAEDEFRIVESDGAGAVRWADNAAALVTKVFTRQGEVVAEQDDYTATLIDNDSSVAGTDVKAALETLDTDHGDHLADSTNPHDTTLQGVLADATSPDNDMTVPSGAPVVLQDGAVAGLTPFSVIKENALTDPNTPTIYVEHTAAFGGIDVKQLAANLITRLTPGGVVCDGDTSAAGYTFGITAPTSPGDGKNLQVGGGNASDTGDQDGGDLNLLAGKGIGSGTAGKVTVGGSATFTSLVELGFAAVPTNILDDLGVTGDITVGGTVDTVDVAGLKSDFDDHSADHFQGGSDEVTAQDLGSGAEAVGKLMFTDGAGGWTVADEDTIDHDGLTNHVPEQHIRWDLTGATQVHEDRYSGGTGGATNTVAGTSPIENTGNNTNAVLALESQAEETFLGRASGAGAGVPGVLTQGQAQTALNVQDGSTDDQTGAEIKTAYEAEANAYTDAKDTRLANTSGTNTDDEVAATESVAGIVELAFDTENAPNVVVQGNDARLADDRDPTSHQQPYTTIEDLPEFTILGKDTAGVGICDALLGSEVAALLDHADLGANIGTTTHANIDSQIPTTDEKAALVGTGTPSGSNVYVTENENTLLNLPSFTLANLNTKTADATLANFAPTQQPVTLATMADLAQDTIIGRAATAGTGLPTALTDTEVRTIINVEDGATADQTADDIEGIVTHDNLLGVAAEEHTDWSSDQSGSPTIHTGNVAVATTTTAGIVELATDGEDAADVVVQGNDARLDDARTPTSHAYDSHSGTVPIADIAGTPTGTGDLVLESSPTIVTPTIASFTNSAHDHEDAAGGAQLTAAALTSTALSGLTEEVAPTSGDLLLIQSTEGIRKLDVDNLPSGSEVNNLESTCGDIEDNEVFVGTTTDTGTYIALPTSGLATFDGSAFAGITTLSSLNTELSSSIDEDTDPRPADQIVTSGTDVTISSTAPGGAGEALVTTSATGASWTPLPTWSKSVTIEAPASGDKIDMFVALNDITITGISYFCRGTTPSVPFNVAHGSNPTSIADIDSTGWTASNTTSIIQDTSFSGGDVTVTANSVVVVDVTGAVTGTNPVLHITVFYAVD